MSYEDKESLIRFLVREYLIGNEYHQAYYRALKWLSDLPDENRIIKDQLWQYLYDSDTEAEINIAWLQLREGLHLALKIFLWENLRDEFFDTFHNLDHRSLLYLPLAQELVKDEKIDIAKEIALDGIDQVPMVESLALKQFVVNLDYKNNTVSDQDSFDLLIATGDLQYWDKLKNEESDIAQLFNKLEFRLLNEQPQRLSILVDLLKQEKNYERALAWVHLSPAFKVLAERVAREVESDDSGVAWGLWQELLMDSLENEKLNVKSWKYYLGQLQKLGIEYNREEEFYSLLRDLETRFPRKTSLMRIIAEF